MFFRAGLMLLALLGTAGTAAAADMPLKAPAPIVAPAFSWTGFYLGVNAGGAWGKADTKLTGSDASFQTGYYEFVDAAGTRSFSPSSFIGGVQAGYNWQVRNIVLGLEADFNSMRLKGSLDERFSGTPAFPVASYVIHTEVATSWFATARGRAGIASHGLLLFGTGGIAMTEIELSQNANFPTFPGRFETVNVSKTKVGWTIGGGFEWALANNWSVKGEYLYADFGSVTAAGTTSPALSAVSFDPSRPWTHSADVTAHIVRAGLNYRFNAPVMARY